MNTLPKESFQTRVRKWMISCFGVRISNNTEERNFRFFEEASELVQSLGMTREQAHALVDYTYNRPIGDPIQEVGGVMVTLAALCEASNIKMDKAAEVELTRILQPDIMHKIRIKQASKQDAHNPLPEA